MNTTGHLGAPWGLSRQSHTGIKNIHLSQRNSMDSTTLRLAKLPVAGLGLLLELLALSKLCLCMLELPYANGAGGRI